MNLDTILSRYNPEEHDAIVQALMDGQYLDALWQSENGRAIAKSFTDQIRKNVVDIVGLCVAESPRIDAIRNRAMEVAFSIKAMQRIERMIETKNELLKKGDVSD